MPRMRRKAPFARRAVLIRVARTEEDMAADIADDEVDVGRTANGESPGQSLVTQKDCFQDIGHCRAAAFE